EDGQISLSTAIELNALPSSNHCGGRCGYPCCEPIDQRAFAHAGFANHEKDLRLPVEHSPPALKHRGEFAGPAHENLTRFRFRRLILLRLLLGTALAVYRSDEPVASPVVGLDEAWILGIVPERIAQFVHAHGKTRPVNDHIRPQR